MASPLTSSHFPQSRLSLASTSEGAHSANPQQSFEKSHLPESAEGVSMFNRRSSLSRHFRARPGNVLPRLSTNEVTQGLADVLQPIYGPLKKGVQQLAADAGTCERSARNHLSGTNAMNLTDFFNACRMIPELASWGQKMMGQEADFDPRFQEDLAKFIRAAQQRINRGGE